MALTALIRRLLGNRAAALLVAFLLIGLVALLDRGTGYELRFAVLYLAPIGLATWASGPRSGLVMVAVAGVVWLLSFGSTHFYSGRFFFYWEGVAMLAVYSVFVLLLHRLHSALTRADQRFRRVLDGLHAAVYIADRESGAVLYANASLARLIGGDPFALGAAALSRRFGLDDAQGKSDRERERDSGGGFLTREVRDAASGAWQRVQVLPIPWKTRRHVSVQVITDISAQKRAQAEKQQHQEMRHQNARLAALAEIASSLAHELNQPLMAIASYNDAGLRLLGSEAFDRGQLQIALQRSREQAVRAGRIISRVREFIRSRRPQPSPCDINGLIRESLDLLETQLEASGVTPVLTLAADLPQPEADQTLLVQVVVNLVQNALDAMAGLPVAERRLSLSTWQEQDGMGVQVAITDRGEGISELLAAELYTPLATTKAQGMGLGLSICRSVVEAHGGRIWHHNNAEGGCTFHFTLPLATAEET